MAAEHLHERHQITVSKETLRRWMVEAGLWKAGRRRVVEVYQWRPRRSRCGELVQWDIKFLESMTSEHPLEQVLSGLISRAPGTNRPVLSIPLPESITEGRLTGAIAGLLSRLR